MLQKQLSEGSMQT
uniref:Uncharacterized protein n=1 Tax=Rhizophora mucronata TaxID=61149 RepID=A0A2P2J5L6_RHIMU